MPQFYFNKDLFKVKVLRGIQNIIVKSTTIFVAIASYASDEINIFFHVTFTQFVAIDHLIYVINLTGRGQDCKILFKYNFYSLNSSLHDA